MSAAKRSSRQSKAGRFHDMRRTGLRPLALGAGLRVTVGMSSLLLQLLSRQL